MNPHNPIDDFFRQRLQQYEEESPMYLWSDIEQRRPFSRRLIWVMRRNWQMAAALCIGLSITAGLVLAWEPTPQLSSFPIPFPADIPLATFQETAEEQSAGSREAPVIDDQPETLAIKSSVPVARPARGPMASASGLPQKKNPHFTPAPGLSNISPDEKIAERPATHIMLSYRIPELPRIVPVPLQRGPQCVSFGENGQWKLYADASVAPEIPIRQMEARDPEYADYAEARKATELPQLSFSTAVRLSMVSDFGLAVRTGLQYTQINEKFDFTDNSQERITITNIYGPNGDIIGTDTLIEFGQRRQTANNRYRILDIPLLVGYELNYEKLSVAFNAGAMINVLFKAKGNFLSPDDLRPVDFASDNTDAYPAYRRNIGVGWYAGVGFHYKLGDDLQLLLEPHFRFNPQPVTKDEYVLKQRYMTAGLSLGIRKQI